MNRFKTRAAVCVLLAVAATSCSDSGGVASQGRDTATNPPPPTTTTTTVSDPTLTVAPTSEATTEPMPSEPTQTDDGIASFDDTYTFDDGIKLSIVQVSRSTLSGTGCCGDTGDSLAIFRFKINNGSDKIFDPSGFNAIVSAGKQGKEAERAFDFAQGLGDGFTQKLLPGRVAVADYAYSVPSSDMDDVVVQVDIDYDHESVFFQGAVR